MDKTVFPRWFLRLQADREQWNSGNGGISKGPATLPNSNSTSLRILKDMMSSREGPIFGFRTAVFEPGTVACTPRRNPKVKPSSRKLTSSGGYPCKYGLMALKSTGVGSLGTNTIAGSCAVGSPGSLSTGHFLPSFPCLLLWGKFSLWVLSLGGGPSRLRQFFKEWPRLRCGHEWFQVQPLRVQSPPLWSEKQKPAGTWCWEVLGPLFLWGAYPWLGAGPGPENNIASMSRPVFIWPHLMEPSATPRLNASS